MQNMGFLMNKRPKKIIKQTSGQAGKEMAQDASRLAQTNDDGTVNRLAEVLARRTNAYGQTEMIIRMDASIPEYLFDRLVDANGDLLESSAYSTAGDYGTAAEVHQCAMPGYRTLHRRHDRPGAGTSETGIYP